MTIIRNIEMLQDNIRVYTVLVAFSCFFTFGCDQESQTEEHTTHLKTITSRYSNGIVKTSHVIDKDSLLQGPSYYYFDNGELKSYKEYKNNQIHGTVKEYYENGQLKVIGVIKNNERDSTWTWFYPDGSKEQSGSFINGMLFGEYILYYPNGRMQLYSFSNTENVVFSRSYDSLGNIVSEQGSPTVHIYNRSELNESEQFEFVVYIPDLPYTAVEYVFSLYSPGLADKKIITRDDFRRNKYGLIYVYESRSIPAGAHTLKIHSTLRDSIQNKIYTDTDTLHITIDKSS